ncbi:MAG TPA: GNAT family N-acetyltransferase [Candidatus Nanopelagicales bacterium]|nr:GNAT family N-acetyltransferase [Candidatus Nanopelagicales bacterium]
MTLADAPGPGVVEVVVTDLEMTDPAQLRPGREPDVEATLVRAGRPSPELARFFYRAVGGDWFWVDRIPWTYDEWLAWVSAPGRELWTCWVDGTPAGYFELDPQGDAVELAYFGLLPAFAGLGLGGWLLTRALERAWELDGVRRVWVHTCSLDGPHALANYEARGLVPVASHVELRDITAPTPGPWAGAR